MTDKLVLPSEIPWDKIKGKDLEEMLYWLFDSMGAKDLEWRIGGKGSGAPDQGRDLELSFYTSFPDGELVKQKWWVEAKGRTGKVEPLEVKTAVINAHGDSEVDVIVVATNHTFSNPTRDWVKKWQKDHSRPKVKLWERAQLENLCSKNPIAIIRLFSSALSPQGRLEVTKTKLWDYASFADEPTLTALWKVRKKLSIDSRALVALIASEIANGEINARSWAMFAEANILAQSLSDGLINFLYLIFRVNDNGVRQEPLIGALAYLILVCTNRIGVSDTAALLSEVWDSAKGRQYPPELRKLILQPVLRLLQTQVRDVCTSDCKRVLTDRILLSEGEANRYWQRLSIRSEEKKQDDRLLVLVEKQNVPCKVGFSLDTKNHCPLCHDDAPEENILQTLEVISFVSDFRREEQQ